MRNDQAHKEAEPREHGPAGTAADTDGPTGAPGTGSDGGFRIIVLVTLKRLNSDTGI